MLDQFLAPENIVFSSAPLRTRQIGAGPALRLARATAAALHGATDGDIGVADTLLAWAGIGRVPFLMWLVLFLALFGALGLGLQHLMTALTGGPGSNLLMVPVTAVAALPVAGGATRLVAHILPGLETTAIERDDLVGLYAEISIGTARVGHPARACVTDPHGQPHQIMVEPDSADQVFQTGESVLLVKREGEIFKAFTRGDVYLPRLD